MSLRRVLLPCWTSERARRHRSPNNAEWVITQFATAKAGLILVNINPAYRPSAKLDGRAEQGWLQGSDNRDQRFKTSDYIGMINTLAPELAVISPRSAAYRAAPGLAIGHPDRWR